MTKSEIDKHYWNQVLEFAENLIGNKQVAKEIAVETFIALEKKWVELCRNSEPADIKAFLFLRARELSMEYLRRNQPNFEAGGDDTFSNVRQPTSQTPMHAFSSRLSELYQGMSITHPKEANLREFIIGLQKDLEDCAKSHQTETNTLMQMLAEQTAMSEKLQSYADNRDICIKGLEQDLTQTRKELTECRSNGRPSFDHQDNHSEKIIERQAEQITFLKASLQTSHDQIVHLLKEKYKTSSE